MSDIEKIISLLWHKLVRLKNFLKSYIGIFLAQSLLDIGYRSIMLLIVFLS